MSKKFWAVFILIVVGVFVLAFSESRKETTTSRKIDNPKIVQADDHIRGKLDSTVYMFTYGDFECPACNAWEPEVQKITEEYKDRVAFIFRHFPLTDKHINAFAAARASEAAAKQGKFWEMHDLLYEKWSEWQGDNKSAQGKFEGYAAELNLDLDKFKEDYKSEEVADRVNSDLASASVMGATGTPTFFINGEIIDVGSVSEGREALRRALDAKLNQQ
jgi:protein-disulfide isomerase